MGGGSQHVEPTLIYVGWSLHGRSGPVMEPIAILLAAVSLIHFLLVGPVSGYELAGPP